MAATYAGRFEFSWQSRNGKDYTITINRWYEDGETRRPLLSRHLGGAPELEYSDDGNGIMSSSLTFLAECVSQSEYAELYTTDPLQYQAVLKRGETLIWSGCLVSEQFSEPDMPCPYDVRITAIDNLSMLKDIKWTQDGWKSIDSIIKTCLAPCTHASPSVSYWSFLKCTSLTYQQFFGAAGLYTDPFQRKEMSLYDVLSLICVTFSGTIRRMEFGGYSDWGLVRETDYKLQGESTIIDNQTNHTMSVQPVGQIGSVGYLSPEGYLTNTVIPQNKRITIAADYENRNLFKLLSRAKNGSVDYYRDGFSIRLNSSQNRGTLNCAPIPPFDSTIKIKTGFTVPSGTTLPTSALVNYSVQDTDSGKYLQADGTFSSSQHNFPILATDNEVEAQIRFSGMDFTGNIQINFQAVPLSSSSYVYAIVYGVTIVTAQELPAGFRLSGVIDNGARREKEIEICVSDSDLYSWQYYNSYVLRNGSGTQLGNFSSQNLDGKERYIDFALQENAKRYAQPRIRKSGRLMYIGSYSYFRCEYGIRTLWDGTTYIYRKMRYDLIDDSLDFEAESQPSSSVTYTSEEPHNV